MNLPQSASFHDLLEFIRPALPPGTEVYAVGGAVRDHLMGRPVHDLDLVMQGDALRAARRAADSLSGAFYPLDVERGTGRVLLHRPGGDRLVLDFAVQRGESLEEDLRGRDFTANAIAVSAHDPLQVFDPLGGALDIKERRLRACSPSSLRDDPLRTLRAVRLAAGLGFLMTGDTRALVRAAAPNLSGISIERRRDEILKILAGPKTAAAVRTIDILGMLPLVFPELPALKGVHQSPPHVHDVWEHTVSVLSHLEELVGLLGMLERDPDAGGDLFTGLAVVRLGRYRQQIHEHLFDFPVQDRPWRGLLFLAALYHDTGKVETRSLGEDGRIRFIGHEKVSARLTWDMSGQLRLSTEERRRVNTVVRHHMRPHFLANSEHPPSRRAVYRFFRDTQAAGVDICLLSLADLQATHEQTLQQDTWAVYLDLVRTLMENWWERPEDSVAPRPVIDGRALMERFELKPGPQIGELLEAVREAQATGAVDDAADAYKLVGEILKA